MNKYKSIIIIMFFLCVLSLKEVKANILDYNLLGKVIYLDAGHGGVDVGAVNNNTYEKNLNLKLVKKLERSLIKKGAIIYLTRDGDYDLATRDSGRKRSDLINRAYLINNSDCDMYLSIHLNSSTNNSWRGIQLFYNSNNKDNVNIATTINNILKSKYSYVKDIKEDNNYYMYKNIDKKGILIEAGFISNPEDYYLLNDSSYQDKLVENITEGIINYFNNY